jgi:hypothetical protein
MDQKIIASVISSVILSLAAAWGFAIQPVTAERDEYATNGQLIRDELQQCLQELKACWQRPCQ